MVGESDTVSRSFSVVLNGAIWIGGFLAVFVTIFVVAMAFDSGAGKAGERNRSRGGPRQNGNQSGQDEPSMGLSPETVQSDPK